MMAVQPRVVDAGRGWEWWAEGARLFRARAGMWVALIIVYAIVMVVIGYVPYVGDLGQSLLTPVFMGGLMIACRAVDRGEPLRVSHLFEGFQGMHFVQLLIIGALNVAIVLGLKLVTGAGLLGTIAIDDISMTDPMAGLAGSALAMGATALLMLLLVLIVATAIMMLNWFAPALVALRGVPAVPAMKLSFVASVRNWVAFLVYGIIVAAATVVLGIGGIVLAVVFGAGGIVAAQSITQGIAAFVGFFVVMAIAAILLVAVVGPITVGSVYAGFKDTLDDDDATVTDPAYR